jgi:KDO2-lipid IV(A) lauroyltransferase
LFDVALVAVVAAVGLGGAAAGVLLGHRWTMRQFAALLAFVVGELLRVRRRHVVLALARANIAEPAGTACRMYQALGLGVAELLWLAMRPAADPLGRVRLPEKELVRFSGRGALILTAHTGNWDLVACALARRTPLTVVTKRLKVSWLDRLWQGLRARRGVRLVGEGEAARNVTNALARGELVAMMIDQAPLRRRAVTTVPFLGAPAAVDLAPALLAMRARVPVIAAFMYRLPDDTQQVEISGILEPPEVASRQWAEQNMETVTMWLDAFVRRHPDQWLWMHRRWKVPATANETAEAREGVSGTERRRTSGSEAASSL